uniref:Uncharacterized protein n=1 Tax=viral metagenome TaxID=1070528 RepID=A0A6C0F6M7_9ZZZZ
MFSKKIQHAAALALLFFVVSSPMTYRLVDQLVGGLAAAVIPGSAHWFKVAQAGCPTTYGLVVHSLVFAVVAHYLLHMA